MFESPAVCHQVVILATSTPCSYSSSRVHGSKRLLRKTLRHDAAWSNEGPCPAEKYISFINLTSLTSSTDLSRLGTPGTRTPPLCPWARLPGLPRPRGGAARANAALGWGRGSARGPAWLLGGRGGRSRAGLCAPRACVLSAAPPLGSARAALGYFRLFVLNSGPSLLILSFPSFPPFFLLIFWRGRGRGAGLSRGALCLALPRSRPLLSLCGGARGRTGRGAEDRWQWQGGKPPASSERRPRPSPVRSVRGRGVAWGGVGVRRWRS